MASIDWEKVHPEMAQLVFEQSEKYINTQIAAGIAADQRATSAASTFIGFSGAILAATFGFKATNPDISVFSAGLTAGIGFLVAAACCFYSARPVDFNYPGNQPDNWYSSLAEEIPVAIGGEIENYAGVIEDNHIVLNNNAKWLQRGFWAASLTPVFAFAAYLWC